MRRATSSSSRSARENARVGCSHRRSGRLLLIVVFFFQAEDGIRDVAVTGVQTCALPISAFAIVLYVARRRASYEDLDQRIRSEAELSAAILGESYRARGALVTYDSTGKPALVADIKAVLEAVPE